MINVLVVDDEALVRRGIRLIVDAAPDLEVIAEADSGRSAVDLVAKLRPDVALMDLRMPDMNGIAATRSITSIAGSPPPGC